ncbi:TetR/AcrR family transcriptional regulator [Streptomyces sp. NBC_01476]|uniref:TetR/AcrR family transcriptional regulator n=1 Tax=Streptomyces sp. NBC_01476 TaxID=2903881 RepID=UPI002E379A3A|nr:helix-turn-helix domain-containing protein [Streptomyces sp. NBC_01476]
MSAPERRALMVRMAAEEFARGGFQGTSTESIAARSGVSQPYLFRLFASKRDLFLAAADHGTTRAEQAFREASDGAAGTQALLAGERAWRQLVQEDYVFALQAQVHAAAASDAVIHAAAARQWARLRRTVAAATGLPAPALEGLFGRVLLLSTVTALDPGRRKRRGEGGTASAGPAITTPPPPTARGSRAAPASAAAPPRPAPR